MLLNSASKKAAAVAGSLSLLSYMATGVVSAASAMAYLQYIWTNVPTSAGVVVILLIFAMLTLWGIRDSATVAWCILVCHMFTLILLIIVTVVWLAMHPEQQQFDHNIHSAVNPPTGTALLFGQQIILAHPMTSHHIPHIT